jgi:hypothetical protein
MNGMTKRMLGTQVIVEGKPSHIRYLPQDDTYEFALEFYHSSWQTVYVNQIPVSIHALVLLLPKQWEALMKQIEKSGDTLEHANELTIKGWRIKHISATKVIFVPSDVSVSCSSEDIELKYAKLHMTNTSSLCMMKQI